MLRANSPATTIIDDTSRLQINNNNNQTTRLDNNKRNVGIVWNGEPTLYLVNLQGKKDILNGNTDTSIAPSILVPISAAQNTDMFFNKINANHQTPVTKMEIKPPPPQYEEATKQVENRKKEQSQIMTDVLDILIQNGELPADSVYGTKIIGNRMDCIQVPPGTHNLLKVEPDCPSTGSTLNKPNIGDLNTPAIDGKQLDCDDSMDSFDMLLRQTVQQPKHNPQLDVKENPPIPETLPSYNSINTVGDIKPYEDLELMELMSQQLDMDIGLDQCTQYDHVNNDIKPMTMSLGNSMINTNQVPKLTRRDMNPSLQPSLNEIIQQKQSESVANNYNNNYELCHTTPMDIEEFENSLSSFDFHTIGDIHNDGQINTPQHPFTEQMHGQPMDQHAMDGMHNMQNGAGPSISLGHANIMDLFNTDDFKMSNDTLSWDEVDFAV